MIDDLNICDCDCHDPEKCCMHCAPCCDGECPICHNNVFDMQAHLKDEHNTDEETVNQTDDFLYRQMLKTV